MVAAYMCLQRITSAKSRYWSGSPLLHLSLTFVNHMLSCKTRIRPPQPPDFGTAPCITDNWKWTNYAVITNLVSHIRDYQVALPLHTLGDEGLDIYKLL